MCGVANCPRRKCDYAQTRKIPLLLFLTPHLLMYLRTRYVVCTYLGIACMSVVGHLHPVFSTTILPCMETQANRKGLFGRPSTKQAADTRCCRQERETGAHNPISPLFTSENFFLLLLCPRFLSNSRRETLEWLFGIPFPPWLLLSRQRGKTKTKRGFFLGRDRVNSGGRKGLIKGHIVGTVVVPSGEEGRKESSLP